MTGPRPYGHNPVGRLASLANRFSETTGFTYDNANRLTKKTMHSGQYEDLSYHTRNRLTGVSLKNSGGTSLPTQSYTYDAASKATNHTQDSVSTTYGYDDVGQLTSESRTGYSASYTYDGNGNRATKTLGGVTETYAYDDGDKLTSVTWSGGSKTYGYDAAGRTTSVVTSAGTTTLSYDYESRVTGITYPNSSTNSFTYNGLDTRVGKVDSAGTSTYKRDGAYVTDPVLADGSAAFTPTVSERRSSTTTYFHSGLKNNDRQSNTSQTVTATKQYDAFGMLVSSTGTWKGPFSYAGPFGYQEDGDSGLKLLGHRYYDASTGRFLTRDPLQDARNDYVYCTNRSVISNDRDGLQEKPIRALLIYGDTGDNGFPNWAEGPGWKPAEDWVLGILPKGMPVRKVRTRTEQEFIDTISSSEEDVLILIGHGLGNGFKLGTGFATNATLDAILKKRLRRRFQFVAVISCGQLAPGVGRRNYMRLGKSGVGFSGGMFPGAKSKNEHDAFGLGIMFWWGARVP